jgi:hypothetical protein
MARRVDRGPVVSWCIVSLFVKTRVVRDVDHPGRSQKGSVRIDNGSGVKCLRAVPLKEVEDDDDTVLAGKGGEGIRCRAGDFFGVLEDLLARWFLWIERLKGEFSETDDVGSVLSRARDGRQAPFSVGPAVG